MAGDRVVSSSFSYFGFDPGVHNVEKPFEIVIDIPQDKLPPGYRRSNLTFSTHPALVKDERQHEAEFSLDTHGFCWRIWNCPLGWESVNAEQVRDFGHERVKQEYLSAMEMFIKQELEKETSTRIHKVYIFNYKVRKREERTLVILVMVCDFF
jgi:hypothetical protein